MLDAKNVYSVFITETNAHVNSTPSLWILKVKQVTTE